MSLDAIISVTEIERQNAEKLDTARLEAKQRISEAEGRGKAALEQSKLSAEAEVARLMTESELAAANDTSQLLEKTAVECQILRSKAEGRLEKASELIVGKVVSG